MKAKVKKIGRVTGLGQRNVIVVKPEGIVVGKAVHEPVGGLKVPVRIGGWKAGVCTKRTFVVKSKLLTLPRRSKPSRLMGMLLEPSSIGLNVPSPLVPVESLSSGGRGVLTNAVYSVSSNCVRQSIGRISLRTSFGQRVAGVCSRLNNDKARKSVRPVFGDINVSSGADLYKEVIARLYVQFYSRTQDKIEVSVRQIYFHSDGYADDLVFDFDQFDAFTVLLGILSSHKAHYEAWRDPDDNIKYVNLKNFLTLAFPDKIDEVDRVIVQVESMPEVDADVKDREVKTIPLDYSGNYSRPAKLPVAKGLCNDLMSDSGLCRLACLDRVLYEVILPHVLFHKMYKDYSKWTWPVVRVAMMKCHIFCRYAGHNTEYMPIAAKFAETMFVMMCHHEGVAYENTGSVKKQRLIVHVNGLQDTVIEKSMSDMTSHEPYSGPNSNPKIPLTLVNEVVKYLRMYNLDFSGGTSLDGIVV